MFFLCTNTQIICSLRYMYTWNILNFRTLTILKNKMNMFHLLHTLCSNNEVLGKNQKRFGSGFYRGFDSDPDLVFSRRSYPDPRKPNRIRKYGFTVKLGFQGFVVCRRITPGWYQISIDILNSKSRKLPDRSFTGYLVQPYSISLFHRLLHQSTGSKKRLSLRVHSQVFFYLYISLENRNVCTVLN